MPFTVEDFEDLLRLLNERPEWQERLRRAIMPPELFRLPALVEELAEINRAERERVARLEAEQQATRLELREGFAQTGQRLDRVEGRLDGVDGRLGNVESGLATFRTETNERFDRMDQRFDRMDQRFDRMDQRFDRVDVRLQQTNTDLGIMKGISTEERYRGRLSFFKHLAPEPVALTTNEVSQMTDREVAAGRLSQAEGRRVDLIIRSGADNTPTYLVVEVSWLVDDRDVLRARDRALLLRKAGYQTQAVVAGQRIQDDALALAQRLGVEFVIEDRIEEEIEKDLPSLSPDTP